MSVRKAHNSGRNHLRNVVDYYQRTAYLPPPISSPNTNPNLPEIGHEKAQSVIDSITSSYAAEGQSSSNPMLGQNPGVQPMPPFPFPGGLFPFLSPFPLHQSVLISNVPPGVPPPPFGMPGMPPMPGMPLPQGMIPPPGGRGMPMPPFPPGPGMPALPQGVPFPPPGGLPPNFQFPPPLPGGFQPPPGFPPLPGGGPGFDPQNQGQQGGPGQGQNERR